MSGKQFINTLSGIRKGDWEEAAELLHEAICVDALRRLIGGLIVGVLVGIAIGVSF
jgi:hypothetical protein